MAGKTTYVLQNYVYEALKWGLNNNKNVNVLYFSFEMSKEALFAKILSLYIWDTYEIDISFSEILSLGEIISDEKYEIICNSKAWLETIEKFFTVIDKPINSEQIGTIIRAWNTKFGKFIELEDDQENYMSLVDTHKIVIIDHIKLTKAGAKGSKVAIDDTCDEFIYYKNKCAITGVIIQQANRQSKSLDRRQSVYKLLQMDDMSDSSGPAQASELVIGIYHPHREKISTIDNYNVKILEDRIRVIQLLKGRYGQSDINKSVAFYGEIGMFKEMPKAEEITDYSEIINYLKLKDQQLIKDEYETIDEIEQFENYFQL